MTQTAVATGNRYDRVGNRLGRQVGEDIMSATFNVVNQLQELAAGGMAVVQGELDEPGTVTIAGRATRTDAQNRFALAVPVTTGTNQLTVVSTDVNTNSTTNTATFVVANSGGRTFTYDLNGNTTDDGQRAYEWDAENRLVKINYPGSSNYTQFTYDGLSRRVGIEEVEDGSTVSDRRFVYDGLAIAEERNAGNEVVKRFFPEGVSIFHIPSSSFHSFYYVRDHLGSIRAVVDEDGEERGRWSYSLWGSRGGNEITSDPVEADFGYTGHLEHDRSGLVFALYRAYDPELGRWLSRDPIGEDGGINLYGYVGNNPINMIDLLGLDQLDYYSPGSDGKASSDSRGKPSDAFNAGAHGSLDGTQFFDQKTRKWYDVKKLTGDIRDHPDYNPTKPVRLNICNAGKAGGLADKLSKELGNTVSGPLGALRTPIWKVGPFKIAWPWSTYSPDGWKSYPK